MRIKFQELRVEIHNHFESGSTSQVFNDQVIGRLTRSRSVTVRVKGDKRQLNKTRNEIKKSKKKWKKTIRKIL